MFKFIGIALLSFFWNRGKIFNFMNEQVLMLS